MALASPTLSPRRPAWDVIAVGARPAGAPAAMLLARAGFRVLLVDHGTSRGDSMRCHVIQRLGVEMLSRWGLLARLLDAGTPLVDRLTLDLGDGPRVVSPPSTADFPGYVGPRRPVLEAMLVDAAAEAGAAVLQGGTVDDLLWEDGRVSGIRGHMADGREVVERAHMVVGADGIGSRVARADGAERAREHPAATCCLYGYFAGVPTAGAEISVRSDRLIGAFPTNGDLTCVVVSQPIAAFPAFEADRPGAFMAALDTTPDLAARVAAGQPVERPRGTADPLGFFRTAHGAGWALVGDAADHADPIPADGISDAFLGASLLTTAIERGFSGPTTLDDALAAYERQRVEAFFPASATSNARASFAARVV